MQRRKGAEENGNDNGDGATDAQLNLIRRLGGKPAAGLMKREASAEIDRLREFGQR